MLKKISISLFGEFYFFFIVFSRVFLSTIFRVAAIIYVVYKYTLAIQDDDVHYSQEDMGTIYKIYNTASHAIIAFTGSINV